ncbi:AAA family ATPase [Oecophyllibacter saccharovorans]|uniref:AAA family ATPase n=1 Tax=Oecophyllibacter saccharovorans TaxID=2558360 RepID=UPI00116ED75C|nr:AAA family ATPase [Oecophyllibacter saccharovorans]TPW33758.1 hypothetical protein E3203_08175 [Oecophyllibacter saccharovorans]
MNERNDAAPLPTDGIPADTAAAGNEADSSSNHHQSSSRKERKALFSGDVLASLNEQQRKAVHHILEMENGQFYLNGPAGTGKSFTACAAIAELMKRRHRKGRILILCPTHVAKLQFTHRLNPAWIEGEDPPVVLMTVAAFLGQGPQADRVTGQDYFPKGAFRNIDGFGIIFADEVSMIGEYELGEIEKASRDIPVIYLGDSNQLQPVMRRDASHVFDKMPHMTLTEQMRNSGPVLQLCQELRHRLVWPQKTVREVNQFGDVSQIIVYDTRHEMIEAFLEHLKKSPDPWKITYLAYTNTAVEQVKRLAHHALYGDEVYCVGEYLRLGRHIPWKRRHLGHRGNIIQILEILGVAEQTLARDFTCPVYHLRVRNLDMNVEGEIRCVSPEDQTRFLDLLDTLYQECSRLFAERRMDEYDETRAEVDSLKLLANLKSPYSQTIHSAQGRSIPHVYVDTYNIAEQGRDKRRLMYVACSRTQHDLHVIRITERLRWEMKERRSARRTARRNHDLKAERELW